MKTARIVQILSGVTILLTGLFIFFALLFLAVLPPEPFDLFGRTWSGVRTSGSALVWTSLMVLPIGFVEGGLFWIGKSRAINDVEGSYPSSNVWSRAGQVLVILGLLVRGCAILILMALIGLVLVTLLSLVLRAHVSFSNRVLGLIAVAILYPIARIPIAFFWSKARGSVTRLARKGLATYHLVDGGVEIDLGVRHPRSGQRARFYVGFDELDEIRSFNYVEAQSFLQYTVGPNPNLAVRQTQDLYKFYQGQIPRPEVYTISAANSVGVNTLLRGGNLFYLLSFDADDANDLIQAFEGYKNSSSTIIPSRRGSSQPVGEGTT